MLARNAASIVALDRDARRLGLLAENAARLGADAIEARRGDLLDSATLAGERFDAVLLDAPCSALGTIPRHPEVKWIKRAADPQRLAATQRRLLARASALTGPGGRIVYSTCSTEPDEGEEVVAAFLAAHPGFAGSGIAATAVAWTLSGCVNLSARNGVFRWWQPMSPSAPVPKSHQPRKFHG